MGPDAVTSTGHTGAPPRDAPARDLPADEPAGPGQEAGAEAAGAGRRRTGAVVAALTAVLALPLVVALGALHSPRWYPLLDLAMTELRVRDVGTRHTPLVGLVGRLSSNGNQGSHLGPISFWALAPVYRSLGGAAWSLFVGVVVLNTTAIALTLWVAVRRGGAVLGLGVAAALALVTNLYGSQVLTEPWNPYMPVMWWPLTLLALWAVACDDLPMLPVAVVAGSFCTQTHISYVGIVGGLVAAGLVALAVRWVRLRGDAAARRRLLRWAGISLALGVVLWLPPIVDQVTGDPGNASIVLDHFLEPDEEPIGAARGAELYAVHLNPWRLVAADPALSGSVVPGVALVAAWLGAVAATWRLRAGGRAGSTGDEPDGRGEAAGAERDQEPGELDALLRLHVVVGAALVLGLISTTRILGFIWFYLALWAWTINALLLVAIGWTAVAAWRAWRPPARPVALRAAGGLAAAVLVGWAGAFAVDAVDAEPTQANYSAMVGRFAEAVTGAIDAGEVDGGGPEGRYLLTWTDGVNLGSTGFGLLAELERQGYDVGVIRAHGPGARPHRVMPTGEATAEIHISLGPDIASWEHEPDFEQVVYVDLRSDDDIARYEAARAEAVDQLVELGRDELVPLVDDAPFQLYFDESLPDETREVIKVINDIGQPAAVFVGPVSLAG